MGEASAPGGQDELVPSQQEHKVPLIAQYRQYSQLWGSPISWIEFWEKERATGKSGNAAAPTIIVPSRDRKFLRDNLRASARLVRLAFSSIQ